MLHIENAELSLDIQPEKGGKLAALRYDGIGLLAVPPVHEAPSGHSPDVFDQYSAYGFDDVFPSMGEPGIADHGSIWQLGMDVQADGDSVRLSGRTGPWEYAKRVTLVSGGMKVDWNIKNSGDARHDFVWICHCLWQLEEGMEFYFPEGYTALEGEKSVAAAELVPPENSCIKVWGGAPVSSGACGFVWPQKQLRMDMSFDTATLPYLGFWISRGGWNGTRQFAFEPATSRWETIPDAIANGTAVALAPGEEFTFSIDIKISRATCKRGQ